MQENELKELRRGEGVQVVLGEELQEELAGEELQEELAGDHQEDVRQYDAKLPPIFLFPISLNHFEIKYEIVEGFMSNSIKRKRK